MKIVLNFSALERGNKMNNNSTTNRKNVKTNYTLRPNRTREGFLDYAKKVRQESKDFFNACGNE